VQEVLQFYNLELHIGSENSWKRLYPFTSSMQLHSFSMEKFTGHCSGSGRYLSRIWILPCIKMCSQFCTHTKLYAQICQSQGFNIVNIEILSCYWSKIKLKMNLNLMIRK
jgi:hypothetical protein